ncbi:MAG: DUF1622 domain-containing protein [Acidimicrobiia bacterium]|jgi:uncharacterized membrane protein
MAWLLAAEEGLTIGGVEIGETVAKWIEVAAITAITVGIVTAVIRAVIAWIRSDGAAAFEVFKRGIGRGMLVGLDLLIAADIIKTVTVDPTLENTATLGLLVLIRTFLSWSIVVEVTGRWPWEERLGDTPE